MRLFASKSVSSAREWIRASTEVISRHDGSGVNLELPKFSLNKAISFLNNGNVEMAKKLAKEAEKLTNALVRRYESADRAISRLKEKIEYMRELGIDCSRTERQLKRSQEFLSSWTKEEENWVPMYLEAAETAGSAVEEAARTMELFRKATQTIEDAEKYLEKEFKSNSTFDENVFQNLVLVPGLDLIKEAKKCLAESDFVRAAELAREVKALTKRARSKCLEAAEVYGYCENLIEELKREGIIPHELDDLLILANTAYQNGRFNRVKELGSLLEKKALNVRAKHRSALNAIKEAKRMAENMEDVNFNFREAEAALGDAHIALEHGDYDRSAELASKCKNKIRELELEYERTTREIQEVKEKVDLLKSAGHSVARDAEEMLLKAQRELQEGNYEGSKEDIQIATLLLGSFEGERQE